MRAPFSKSMRIELTPEMHALAHDIAQKRINWGKRRPRYGGDNDPKWEIEGAHGEALVAQHTGIPWDGAIGNFDALDVGPYQVRATQNPDGRLLLHDEDKPARYVLVQLIGCEAGILKGWMYLKDGLRKEWWADPTGKRPAYFVPTARLQPMETLAAVEWCPADGCLQIVRPDRACPIHSRQ